MNKFLPCFFLWFCLILPLGAVYTPSDEEVADVVRTTLLCERHCDPKKRKADLSAIKGFLDKLLLGRSKNEIKIITLAENRLDDQTFQDLTSHLLPENGILFPELKIIDLSYNQITQQSVQTLDLWLRQSGEVQINILANPISLKNVKNLVNEAGNHYNQDGDAIRSFMDRIVFMDMGYARKNKSLAANGDPVLVYKSMMDSGHISENLFDRTIDYYQSSFSERLSYARQKASLFQTHSWLERMSPKLQTPFGMPLVKPCSRSSPSAGSRVSVNDLIEEIGQVSLESPGDSE